MGLERKLCFVDTNKTTYTILLKYDYIVFCVRIRKEFYISLFTYSLFCIKSLYISHIDR